MKICGCPSNRSDARDDQPDQDIRHNEPTANIGREQRVARQGSKYNGRIQYRSHNLKVHIMTTRLFAGMAAAMLCMTFSASPLAQEQNGVNEDIRRLQLMLMVINSELKSDLDQILVLQEAIKANSRTSLATQGRSPDRVTVEDAATADRMAIQREAAINARLDAILARSAMLDAEKQPIVERIRELSRVPLVSGNVSAVELER